MTSPMQYPLCVTAYHVTCGFQQGLDMKTRLDMATNAVIHEVCTFVLESYWHRHLKGVRLRGVLSVYICKPCALVEVGLVYFASCFGWLMSYASSSDCLTDC